MGLQEGLVILEKRKKPCVTKINNTTYGSLALATCYQLITSKVVTQPHVNEISGVIKQEISNKNCTKIV